MFPANLAEPCLNIPDFLLMDPNPRMFLKIKQAILIAFNACVEVISEERKQSSVDLMIKIIIFEVSRVKFTVEGI